ncbi:MAG: DUF1648 domain-containing protein [Terracidiphilus sp.]|nr:DUF1648 domain-containing protein [Terracidiphilus sp.]
MRRLAESFGLAGLVVLVWQTWAALWGPHRLPDRVPTHFDVAGNPNAWGSPSGLLLLPVIALCVYLLISVVARFPQSFNYPVRVTPANVERLRNATLDMLSWVKAEIGWLFAVLQWAFVRSALTGNGALFPKILPVFLVVIFGTVGIHLLAIVRAGRQGS